MLRELRSVHLHPFIKCFKVVYTGGVPAVTTGINDRSSITDHGTGDFTITYKTPFSYESATADWDTAAFSTLYSTTGNLYAAIQTNTNSAVRVDQNGKSADFKCDVIVVGWESTASEAKGMPQRVHCNLRNPRMLAMRMDSGGASLSPGRGMGTVSLVSTGKYKIIYKRAFGKEPCVHITLDSQGGTTGQRAAIIAAETDASQLVFETRSSAGALVASNAQILVIGTDSTDDTGGQREIVQISARGTDLITYGVKMNAANAVEFGSKDYSLTDNGTGDATLTYLHGIMSTSAYAKAPISIACASNATTAVNPVISQTSGSVVRVLTKVAATGANGDTTFSVLSIGFNETTDY